MYMIDMDVFWHQKTFGTVLAELQRNQDEKVNEQDVEAKDVKVNKQNVERENEKEVIDLCDETQTTTSNFWKDNQERK